jgi:N-carbamoylputrescine amidase
MALKVATTQMACSWDREANIARAEDLVREAASEGAQIILVQELFETPYFCIDEREEFYLMAKPVNENPAIKRMSELAKELNVVLPVSIFERANNALFNALVIVDADGAHLGTYRKSHIPDAPGYSEKYYFNPGDSGFPVWQTKYARIGTLICWDQWFPEPVRILALKGAELILYPSAIGSELDCSDAPSLPHWQTVMRGHAAANMVPVVASNRIGTETGESGSLRFFGGSFICDHTGQLLGECDEETQSVLVRELDLEAVRIERMNWGLYRDRRPEMYHELLTLDGMTSNPAARL